MPEKGHKALKEKLHTLAIRLPESAVQALDLEIAHRLEDNPGIIISKSDLARNLILQGIRTFPSAPGSGPVEAPVTLGEDQPADHAPGGADQSAPQAAPSQDHQRTTVRTGRKRQAAAKG